MSYAALVAWLVFTLFPLYWIFSTAFKSRREAIGYPPTLIPHGFTFENFARVLEAPIFGLRPFANSLVLGVGTAGLTVTLAVMAGYAFSRLSFPGRTWLMIGILVANMIPTLGKIIPLFRLYVNLGLYDTRLGLVLLYSASSVPIATWVMKGFYDTIPQELEEAAKVDGCSTWQALMHITMPLSAPGVAAAAVISFSQAWNEFLEALVLTSSASVRPYTVALYRFVGEYGEVEWHLISAAAFLAAIPTVLAFGFFQRHFVSGLTRGAVKG